MKQPHAKHNDHLQPMEHLMAAAKANHRKKMNAYNNLINAMKLIEKRNGKNIQ